MIRKIVILILIGTLSSLSRDITKTEWMALFINKSKSGYMKTSRRVKKDTVITGNNLVIEITRGSSNLLIKIKEQHRETIDGKPLSFMTAFSNGGIEQVFEGSVNPNGKVTATITIGQNTSTRTGEWPKGAVLAEGLRLLQKQKGFQRGTKYEVQYYQPMTFNAESNRIEIGDIHKIDILGRILFLREITMTTRYENTSVVTKNYVDDKGNIMKSNIPMMGMELTLLSCDSLYAKSKNEPNDFFNKVIISSPKSIPANQAKKRITYTLKSIHHNLTYSLSPTDEQAITFDSSNQTLKITVQTLNLPKGGTFPYRGNDPQALSALESAVWVQKSNKKIIALAYRAIGNTARSSLAVKKIESFVHNYITNKNLSIGYASAAEVAKSREGDCTEHAVLTTAMCRAVGIPARMVVGLAYIDNFLGKKCIFVPHAWTQVFINGKWYSIDAALGEFNSLHLAYATGNGSPSDFFSLINILGNVTITDITMD